MPPFFPEPEHPPSYPAQFVRAGFAPMAFYRSALNPDVRRDVPELPSGSGFARVGLTLRPLCLDQLDVEAHALYWLTARCFTRNFLYTPMPEAVFAAQFQALLPHLHPDLVLIAEAHGRPAGAARRARRYGDSQDVGRRSAWAGRGVGS